MKKAELFLKKLTELIPPGDHQRHNLTVDQDGMLVTLMLGDIYLSYALEEENMKNPLELAERIARDAT